MKMSENANTEQSTQRSSRTLNFDALKQHVLTHKIEVGLWALRVLTILLTIGYFIPIFGNAHNAYYKALLSNAAISALRLHQHLGRVQFTREFLAQLLLEDSCHYLFYSIIFIYLQPFALAILPVFLFAVLHVASYSLTLLDVLGQNSWWGARLLILIVEYQYLNILRLTAFTEIILMPVTIILLFMGRAAIATPIIYYQFLIRRYTSRRNPYTRNMFHELRILFENTAAKPGMPGFLRQLLLGIVSFTSKLAPPAIPSPQQAQ